MSGNVWDKVDLSCSDRLDRPTGAVITPAKKPKLIHVIDLVVFQLMSSPLHYFDFIFERNHLQLDLGRVLLDDLVAIPVSSRSLGHR